MRTHTINSINNFKYLLILLLDVCLRPSLTLSVWAIETFALNAMPVPRCRLQRGK